MGAFAVYVFFILSGYWIAAMWETKYSQSRSPYMTFVVSRWLRLAPVFLCCLGIETFVQRWVNGETANFVASTGWWLRQLPIAGSGSAGRILPPSWSIDVEMQFYVLFPLVLLVANTRARICAVCSCSMALLVWQEWSRAGFESLQVWPFLGFFGAGMIIQKFQWVPSRHLAEGVALCFIVGSTVLILIPSARPVLFFGGAERHVTQAIETGRWVWATAGALLVIPVVARNVRMESSAFDMELGNLSYPLYLFHWVPRDWYYAQVDWLQPAWRNGLLLLINLGAAFFGAWLIRFWIDRPVDRMRSRWVASRRLNVVRSGKLRGAVASASVPRP